MKTRAEVPLTRRAFLSACGPLAAAAAHAPASDVLTAKAVGGVDVPPFYRHDVGTAPGRMHEPTAGPDGTIWTSPLDGTLWRYDTATGAVEIQDLQKLTGRGWKGLHLWPVARGRDVYLCSPTLPELWVYHRDGGTARAYRFPHDKPAVYGGFVVPGWDRVWFYDTARPAVLGWDPGRQTGELYPCPYRLSGTLYMTFADPERRELWGSTYTGNDLVRFDVRAAKWTGHFRCPLPKATPTPANAFFGPTLYASDHLNGRLVPFDPAAGRWGDPVAVPGFREWFGYLSGGWHFRGKLYFCHSTWTGGNDSLDGEPHHFLGSWTVFDPKTRRFARLDIPTRDGEDRKYLQADYCAVHDDELFILAVNAKAPRTALVLRTRPLR